jgi:PKD repeat protein/sugar lactone lactonase YvrE
MFSHSRAARDGTGAGMLCGMIVAAMLSCLAAHAADTDYVITTIAGSGDSDHSGDGGAATSAGVRPEGIALDANGNLYIADARNGRVRKVDAATGIISTIAGTGNFDFEFDTTKGGPGDGGPATAAELAFPDKVVVDPQGNVYISDTNAGLVRKVDTAGIITTVVSNSLVPKTLFIPRNLVADAMGNIYVTSPNIAADKGSYVYKIDAATGAISTVLSQTTVFAMALDNAGNLYYITSSLEVKNGLYKLELATGNTTLIDDSNFNFDILLLDNTRPCVGLDGAGNIYIGNRTTIKKIDAETGFISTIAGTGVKPEFGELSSDGPALSSKIQAVDMGVDSAGNIYIADDILRVRKISPASGPVISATIASSQDPSQVSQSVTFTATASAPSGLPLTYAWDFGDGVTTNGNPVSHAFNTPGAFDVRLTVSDGTLTRIKIYPQVVVAPSSTGLNVTNAAQGLPAVENPLNGLAMSVVESNGGIVKLLVDGSALSAAPLIYKTYFSDPIPGRTLLAPVIGPNPVHKFTKQGVFFARSEAYDATTLVLLGTAQLILAIGENETDDPISGSTTTRPSSPLITVQSVKGKVSFPITSQATTSKPKKPKADLIDFAGTLELPGGIDLKSSITVFVGVANVAERREVTNGKLVPGSTGALKKFQLRASKDGKTAAIKLTVSKLRLVPGGLSFYGIANTPAPGKTPKIQVAMTLKGHSYFALAPVQLVLSKDGSSGKISTPKTK